MYRFLSSRVASTSCAKLSQRVKRFSSTLKNEENLVNDIYVDAPVGLKLLSGSGQETNTTLGKNSSETPQKRTVRILDAGLFVPTTEFYDNKSGDEISLDSVLEGLLQNGVNVSEAIADVSDLYIADSALNIHEQAEHSHRPSTSTNFQLNQEERTTRFPGRRRIITKKIQRTLLKRSMTANNEPSVDQPATSNAEFLISQPRIFMDEPELSSSKTVEVFHLNPDRNDVVTISEIEDALRNQDIQSLRNLFARKKWPMIRGILPYRVLQLVVDKAKNYDEAVEFFKDYASLSPTISVSDHLAMKLAVKAATENENMNPITAAIEALENHRRHFVVRPAHAESRAEFNQLIKIVGAKNSINDCIHLYEAIQSNGFYVDAERFVQAICQVKISLGVDYTQLKNDWKELCAYFSVTHSFDIIIRKILEERTLEDQRCGELLAFTTEARFPPSSALAEIVCAFVVVKRQIEADKLLQRVFVKPSFFKRPLSRFLESPSGVNDFELVVKLLGKNLFIETKKGGKRAPKRRDEVESNDEINEELMKKILTFCGIRETRKPQKDIKALKFDSGRLAELSTHIQKIWIKFARKHEDLNLITRLHEWCRENRMELSPESEKEIRQLKGDLERKSIIQPVKLVD